MSFNKKIFPTKQKINSSTVLKLTPMPITYQRQFMSATFTYLDTIWEAMCIPRWSVTAHRWSTIDDFVWWTIIPDQCTFLIQDHTSMKTMSSCICFSSPPQIRYQFMSCHTSIINCYKWEAYGSTNEKDERQKSLNQKNNTPKLSNWTKYIWPKQ